MARPLLLRRPVRFAVVVFLTCLLGHARGAGVAHIDADVEATLWNRVNQARLGANLPPLERDERLRDVARFHSADMALAERVSASPATSGSITDRAAAALGLARDRVIVQVALGASAELAGLTSPGLQRAAIGVVCIGGHAYVTALAVTSAGAAPTLLERLAAVFAPVPELSKR